MAVAGTFRLHSPDGKWKQTADHHLLRFMNKPAAFLLLTLALGFNISCEQQSYEETKMFNQSSKPGGHGHGAAVEHNAAKGAAAEHPAPKQ